MDKITPDAPSKRFKIIKLGDKNPEPCERHVIEAKKYIMLNYDGNIVNSSDYKGPLHQDAMDTASESCIRGAETEYMIVKAGKLYYYWHDMYGWLVDSKSTLENYTASSSTYWKHYYKGGDES